MSLDMRRVVSLLTQTGVLAPVNEVSE